VLDALIGETSELFGTWTTLPPELVRVMTQRIIERDADIAEEREFNELAPRRKQRRRHRQHHPDHA
jgi:hypothetical protein